MKDYILEARKLIPSHICKKIIAYFDDHNLEEARIGTSFQAETKTNKEIRNCLTSFILTNPNKTLGQTIMLNYILDRLDLALKSYSSKFPRFTLQKINQLDLLKYEKNSYDAGYKFHVDASGKTAHRILSLSLCLNDSFGGGEFVFDLPDGQVQFQQNTGDLIIFPSNFMFPHQVNSLTYGTRYALIAWAV